MVARRCVVVRNDDGTGIPDDLDLALSQFQGTQFHEKAGSWGCFYRHTDFPGMEFFPACAFNASFIICIEWHPDPSVQPEGADNYCII